MLKDLGAEDLKSGDWMVRVQIAKYEVPLQRYIESGRSVSLENQAKFLQQLARATCEADFTYAGFIDVNDRPVLRQINASAQEYWGWGSRTRSPVLLLLSAGENSTLEKVAEPLPFTPLFVFNGDRRHILIETARSASYPVSQTAGILPPFFNGL
jgi:hypothetical protein